MADAQHTSLSQEARELEAALDSCNRKKTSEKLEQVPGYMASPWPDL
jgi:hypothetical protein